MKILFYPFIALSLLVASCSKSTLHHTNGTGPTGSWLLTIKDQVIGPQDRVIKPARDSSVLLTLNNDRSFVSRLDNKVISQGTFSITDTSSAYGPSLELKYFKTTGIFNLFTVYQLGSGGQVQSVYNGMTMQINGDTMTLTSVITPGGWTSYEFVRE